MFRRLMCWLLGHEMFPHLDREAAQIDYYFCSRCGFKEQVH